MDSDNDLPVMRVVLLTLPGAIAISTPVGWLLQAYLPSQASLYFPTGLLWAGIAALIVLVPMGGHGGLAALKLCLKSRPANPDVIWVKRTLILLNLLIAPLCLLSPIGFLLVLLIRGASSSQY